MAKRQLVMVYNAPKGLLYAVRDSFWKTFFPSSYPCALCALAFGFFTARGAWSRFLERVPVEKRELHRDDYRAVLPEMDERLPVILLIREDGTKRVIASATEMEALEDVEELITLVSARIEDEDVVPPRTGSV